MGKFILLVLGILIAYWLIRGYRRRRASEARPPLAGEDMVCCVHCGIHLPRSEGIVAGGETYCSTEHQRLHDTRAP